MNRNTILLFSVLLFAFSIPSNAQDVGLGVISGGSSIGGKIVQNDQTVKSGFSPEIDLYGGLFTDNSPAIGLFLEFDTRLINVKDIDFFEKSYKCVFDLYIGPAILIGEPDGGVVVSGLIGYSVSDFLTFTGSDDVNFGSLSFKIAADIVLDPICIGVFFRPETQLIKEKRFESQYGWEGNVEGFSLQPAWGIRLGFNLSEL